MEGIIITLIICISLIIISCKGDNKKYITRAELKEILKNYSLK